MLVFISYSAPANAVAVEGSGLSPLWGLPFLGLVLSIAFLPLFTPVFWHHHSGKVSLLWVLLLILPCAVVHGASVASERLAHALLTEYFPFIILLATLYTIAGGLCICSHLRGSPAMNTGLLAFGTLLASVMGTTGAAMLLIRPLLRANDKRRHTVHIVIFFIFLVANIGGGLTPLGDPPLFLGFLNGVGFFWTSAHLFKPMLLISALLLALFYLMDMYYFHRREKTRASFLHSPPDSPSFSIEGKVNFVLLAGTVALVLMSGLWKPGIAFNLWGASVELQDLVRGILLLGIMAVSLWLTPRSAHTANDFNWAPIAEVAKLFAGIFITITPVIAILRAGEAGAFAFVGRAISDMNGQPINVMVFWVTGLLSSFLDNAPTYLVFFNTLGGDAHYLMKEGATTLTALSAGAVFMGATTYIGNAPNFMVKAIAQSRGIRMPGFFGFMAWSGCILMPIFALTTWIFFR